LNRDELVSLVRGHQAQVYRYLRYLGAAHDVAEDLAQDTFVVALSKGMQNKQEKWSESDPVNRPAWLRGVSRNLFLAYCRRARCSPVFAAGQSLDHAEALWAAQFPGSDDGSAHLAALRQCLEVLPQRDREIIQMQYALKKSRAEIAASRGLSEDGVKTLMRRLRAALAECIQGRLKSGGRA
jgi:RNA polymerase sigma-70 factor (ECF subfamily)